MLLLAQQPEAVAPAPKKTTVIRFYAPITEDSIGRLLNVIDSKLKEGTRRFVLLISSPGGSVFAGLTAYHYLRGIPAEIVTHNFGEVDSIATVIYCAGATRYSVPQGRFLLHPIAANFAAGIPFDTGIINEQLKLMQQQSASIASVISETVKKPLPDVETIITGRTTYSATDAQKFGLVTAIRSELFDEGSDLVSIGAIQPQGEVLRAAKEFPKETTYTTNINRFFTTLPDFSTGIPNFFTKHQEFFTKPAPTTPTSGM